MRILVTGGTGHLGREFVRQAAAAGYDIRVASRRPRPESAEPMGVSAPLEWATIDLAEGEGLDAAVAGVDAVLHAAGDPRHAVEVDVEGTRRLAVAAREAEIEHFVYISIVGIDRIPFPYYRHKLAGEEIVTASGLPYSILRASQFHYFIDSFLGLVDRTPFVLPLPAGCHVQTVAAAECAARLLRSVAAGPGQRLRDFAGPERMTLDAAAADWKAARGSRKPTLPIPIPGKTAAAFRAGYNTAPDAERGELRWKDWLAARYGTEAD